MHRLLNATRIKSAIRDAKSEGRELWLSDNPGTRGTGRVVLRVSPFGVARFYYRPPRAYESSSQAIPMGIYSRTRRNGHMTLSEARQRASELSVSTFTQSKPRTSSQTSQPRERAPKPDVQPTHGEPPAVSLIELCRSYAQKLEDDGKASASEVRGTIERHIAPSILAHQAARDIKSATFTNLIRDVVNNVSGNTASGVRSILHAAYARAMRAKFDPTAPVGLIDFGVESNRIESNRIQFPAYQRCRNSRLLATDTFAIASCAKSGGGFNLKVT